MNMFAHAPPEWYIRKQFGLLRWNLAHTSAGSTAAIRVVHGSPLSPWDGLSPEEDLPHLDECLATIAEQVLVCGHSHIPFSARRGSRLALNPGAVCGPLDGQTGAAYALLE